MTRLIPVLLVILAMAAPCPAPTGKGRLFSASADQGIVEIDPVDGTLLNTFATPTKSGVSDGLAFDGTNPWYISGSLTPNKLYRLDPDTGAVRQVVTLADNNFRNGLTALNGRIWVSHYGAAEQDLVAIDPSSGQVVDTIDVDGVNSGLFFAGGLGAMRNPDYLLIPDAISSLIYLINLDTGLAFAFDGQLSGDTGLAAIGTEIYASVNTGLVDQVTVFDISGAVQRRLTVAGSIGLQSLAGATQYVQHRLGVFINGTWYVDRNGDGEFQGSSETRNWGSPGDTPVDGDWSGDGVFDPSTDSLAWGEPGAEPARAGWE